MSTRVPRAKTRYLEAAEELSVKVDPSESHFWHATDVLIPYANAKDGGTYA
eukprot:CAMPEP_0202053844 /NCGR_PEP_ID=MMETSP0963-20130614/6094_1 /ASSEMBLY_ACC=CAM_ASM_000494 /TAXON_ID=4773 /ORGANISM="Schizochytrium aggregatum, Strain ATCC28209" /LENGTH=50 /DNA_ID=CAMNT_0048619211 /DNA_START=896 /DNA_END=1044 /DNA_ORIENTATION=+